MNLLSSLSHNTELATAAHTNQSAPRSPTVPKARWRNGTYNTST